MQKDKKNVFIFIIIILLVVVASYFLFSSGTSDIIKASIRKLRATANLTQGNTEEYPVINMVINSSGGEYVNTDVAITINATCNYNIENIEYSFDKETWNEATDATYGKEAKAKLVFTKSINKTLYIRVRNELGYSSYYFDTPVKIDKDKPVVKISNNVITVTDNNGVSNLQYSNDGITWEDDVQDGSSLISKDLVSYKYVRAVDIVGNISSVKEIK